MNPEDIVYCPWSPRCPAMRRDQFGLHLLNVHRIHLDRLNVQQVIVGAYRCPFCAGGQATHQTLYRHTIAIHFPGYLPDPMMNAGGLAAGAAAAAPVVGAGPMAATAAANNDGGVVGGAAGGIGVAAAATAANNNGGVVGGAAVGIGVAGVAAAVNNNGGVVGGGNAGVNADGAGGNAVAAGAANGMVDPALARFIIDLIQTRRP